MNAMMMYQVNATSSALSVVVNTAPMSGMPGKAAYSTSAAHANSSKRMNMPTVITLLRLRIIMEMMMQQMAMVSRPYATRVTGWNAMGVPSG